MDHATLEADWKHPSDLGFRVNGLPHARLVEDQQALTPLTRRSALLALEQLGEVLYAARFPDGIVKIGHSANIGSRFECFPEVSSSDIEVLAIRFGSRDDEAELHRRLRSSLARGREWYLPTQEVMAVVNEWRAAMGRPPVET